MSFLTCIVGSQIHLRLGDSIFRPSINNNVLKTSTPRARPVFQFLLILALVLVLKLHPLSSQTSSLSIRFTYTYQNIYAFTCLQTLTRSHAYTLTRLHAHNAHNATRSPAHTSPNFLSLSGCERVAV